MPIEDAVDVIDEWLTVPNVRIIEPTPHYWRTFREILVGAQVHGPLVTDAHFAALALEHDASICTADRDFQRFKGIRIVNPFSS